MASIKRDQISTLTLGERHLRIIVDGRYIQDYFPGVGRYTYNLIRALGTRAIGDEIVVLHNPALPNSRYDVTSLGALPDVHLVEINSRPLSLFEQWQIPRTVGRLAPQLFHTPFYLKPYLLRCPSIVTIFDLIPLRYPADVPGRGKRMLFWLLCRLACQTSRAVLTSSESSRRDLVECFGLVPERVHTVPLGVDECFQQQPTTEVERVWRRYGLAERYVLYVGSNKPRKNLVRLVEAWAEAKREARRQAKLNDVQLVLAGHEDPRYPQVRAKVSALGVEDSVRFTGEIAEHDLPALYSGAELFVFPSLYEGFGLPVLEAMACGTPVVCSNTSSVPEVAGDAAVYVNPRDVSALAQAISRVLGDRILCDELRSNGFARANAFSWRATADATYQAYQEAIEHWTAT